MSGRRDESLVLDDIIQACERLIELGGGVRPGEFGADRGTSEMILWNLLVLGEAAKRLSPSTQTRFGDVPWSELARTRDRVAHHYDGIDWRVVAETISSDCPRLLPDLIRIRDVLRAEDAAG